MTDIINQEQLKKLFTNDDMDFYEENLLALSDEQIELFYEDNPDFMEEYDMYKERLPLLRDRNYREILRKIKKKREQK